MTYCIDVPTPAARRAKQKLSDHRLDPAKFEGLIQDVTFQINGKAEFAKSLTFGGTLKTNGRGKEREFSYRRADIEFRLWFLFEIMPDDGGAQRLSLLEFDVFPVPSF